MKGYCPTCEQLVTLITGPLKREDSRQRWYWTAEHLAQGKQCEGGRL